MTTNVHQTRLTLLLGGTGKTGRRVAARLAARKVPLRIGSRAAELPFDWEQPHTWAPVLHDVDAVYITYYPDIAAPSAADAIRSFSRLAVEHGVKRLVLLSGRGEDEAQHCEQIVQTSGAEWTILRASWFAQNFSENFFHDIVMSGEVALPIADVAEPFVDAEDIADVVVAALTEKGHSGHVYEVTGPRLLTFAEAVAEIADATGRDIRFVPISLAAFRSTLEAARVPADMIALLSYLFTTVLDGRNAFLTDDVQRTLGRAPRDFALYARETAATGVWNK